VKALAREAFDKSFWIFAIAALVTGIACYLVFGADSFSEALTEDATLVGFLVPKLGAAVLIAAFLQALVPPSFFAKTSRRMTWNSSQCGGSRPSWVDSCG
jgi:hypothetical protein